MKTLLLSMFDGLFMQEVSVNSERNTDTIFLKDTDPVSGRTLMIEEDAHNIWAYMLSPDKAEIDFEGFLCTVVDPHKSDINYQEISKADGPISANLTNSYTYIKNIKKKHITIHWKKKHVVILIKNKVHLVMDMNTKTSYSKGLSEDCTYGKVLQDDMLH